jgi:malic enzyme
VLSVVLDVGTDNEDLLNDELYLGLREKRTHSGPKYDGFVDAFVQATQNLWPGVFVHFEDFGRENAARLLDKYRPDIPCFNDDIQGTGCVVLASVLASMKAQDAKLKDQTFLVHGAGTAGMGIAEWIVRALGDIDGVDEPEAKKLFWLIDKQGLLFDDDDDLTEHQKAYARSRDDVKGWKGDKYDLMDVVKQAKPTVIIGTSAQKGSWTEELVKTMVDAAGDKKAIFLPLSNPTRLEEATPDDIIKWSNNKAHVATGSPFDPVEFDGKKIEIGEANNALCYP